MWVAAEGAASEHLAQVETLPRAWHGAWACARHL